MKNLYGFNMVVFLVIAVVGIFNEEGYGFVISSLAFSGINSIWFQESIK